MNILGKNYVRKWASRLASPLILFEQESGFDSRTLRLVNNIISSEQNYINGSNDHTQPYEETHSTVTLLARFLG